MRLQNKKNTFGRREFLGSSLLSVIGACGLSRIAYSNPGASKPNILFVFADQLRNHVMGYMEQEPVVTPNFDRISRQGQYFINAISNCPICTPYRAMLMTGRYPLTTKMTVNSQPGLKQELSADETCIAEVLKSAGYSTGYIGKWHLDSPSLNRSDSPKDGATAWDCWTEPGPRRQGFDYWHAYNTSNNHFHPHYWENSPTKKFFKEWSPKHETDVAIDFMQKVKTDKPFALFMSWNPPHGPYVAPKEYVDLYEGKKLPLKKNAQPRKWQKNYYGAVTSIDSEFGRLMKYLDSSGLSENTIVVFTADHGEMMGSHGYNQKTVFYEESINVPLIIRWPGKIKPKRNEMIFNAFDFMPTLLGLAGLRVPGTVEGTDYSATLLGKNSEEPDSAFIAHYPAPGKSQYVDIKQACWWAKNGKVLSEKGYDCEKWGYRGVRTKRYTYIVDRMPSSASGKFSFEVSEINKLNQIRQLDDCKGAQSYRTRRYLFDNKKDPLQLNPTVVENIEDNRIAVELENELKKWLEKMKDPFPLL